MSEGAETNQGRCTHRQSVQASSVAALVLRRRVVVFLGSSAGSSAVAVSAAFDFEAVDRVDVLVVVFALVVRVVLGLAAVASSAVDSAADASAESAGSAEAAALVDLEDRRVVGALATGAGDSSSGLALKASDASAVGTSIGVEVELWLDGDLRAISARSSSSISGGTSDHGSDEVRASDVTGRSSLRGARS